MSSGLLCAYCRRRPVEPRWRPFCSERCKLLDLGQWVDGAYRVPGEPVTVAPEASGERNDTGNDTDTHD